MDRVEALLVSSGLCEVMRSVGVIGRCWVNGVLVLMQRYLFIVLHYYYSLDVFAIVCTIYNGYI